MGHLIHHYFILEKYLRSDKKSSNKIILLPVILQEMLSHLRKIKRDKWVERMW